MDKAISEGRLALSAEEVCRALGISKSAFYEAIARGEFPPARKLGRRSLWSKRMVEEWLTGNSVDAEGVTG